MGTFKSIRIASDLILFLLEYLLVLSLLHNKLTLHLHLSAFEKLAVLSLCQLPSMLFSKVDILWHKSLVGCH